MNPEVELNLVADRIAREAERKRINLSDPANAFTVWVDHRGLGRLVYGGGHETHSSAAEVAADHAHPENGDVYIAMGPLSNLTVMKSERG